MATDPWDRLLADVGYVACGVCEEIHRPPQCDVDGEGYALARCGCRWVDTEEPDWICRHREPDEATYVPRVVDVVLPKDGPL